MRFNIQVIVFVMFLLPLFSQEVPFDPSQIQRDVFDMIHKNLFHRINPAVQQECLDWKENYIHQFGFSSFQDMVGSYVETPRFKKYRMMAEQKQSEPDAVSLKKRIDLMYYRIQETYENYRDLKNESIRWDREKSSIRQIFLRKRLIDSRNQYNEFMRLLKEYNQLVEKYNSIFLGCEEFLDQEKFQYREKRL